MLKRDDRLVVVRRLAAPLDDTAIEASETLGVVHAAKRQVLVRTLAAAAGVVLLGGLYFVAVGFWFVAKPVQALTARLRRAGSEASAGATEPTSNDELGELAEEADALSTRLRENRSRLRKEQAARQATVEQLRHADRLSVVGQLAAGVAHELGTPLNVIMGHAKMLAEDGESAAERSDSMRVIGEQAVRMANIIRQLLDFARRGDPKFEISDLRPVVSRTLQMLTPAAHRRQVSLEYRPPTAAMLLDMDEAQLQQVLTNMVVNALQAMPDGGGKVSVALDDVRVAPPGTSEPRPYVRIAIADEGVGIPSENLPRLFEPFFTTKSVGEGTGLGLPVSYGIVQEHGGWIAVDSTVGRGTRFDIFLPRVAEAEAA
jgi:signal transduction histidine kinase